MNIKLRKSHRLIRSQKKIRNAQALGLILILLLSGCTMKNAPQQAQMVQEIQSKYTVTEIVNSPLLEGNYEYHEVYNNQISVIGLKNFEAYCSSTDLFLLNLNNGEMEKIDDIVKAEETNRIWNFIRLDSQTYLYTEVAYPSLSDLAFMQYNVYLQKDGNRQKITGGTVSTIYELPEFLVMDESFVFAATSYEFSQEEENGQVQFEIWEVNDEDQKLLLKHEGSYSQYQPDETTEYLSSRLSLVNESEICFTTEDATNCYLNCIRKGKETKQKITKELINAIPFENQWLVTEGNLGSMNLDTFRTYLLDDQELRYDLSSPIRVHDYCALRSVIVGSCDQHIVIIQIRDREIGIIQISEVKEGFALRKINDHAILILDAGGRVIRVDIEEEASPA